MVFGHGIYIFYYNNTGVSAWRLLLIILTSDTYFKYLTCGMIFFFSSRTSDTKILCKFDFVFIIFKRYITLFKTLMFTILSKFYTYSVYASTYYFSNRNS